MELTFSAGKLDEAAKSAQRFLREERDIDVPESVVREGIRSVMERRLDVISDDLAEAFSSPRFDEANELEYLLAKEYLTDESVQTQTAMAPVFSGNVEFAPSKYSAMIEYIAGKGLHIYKTNLNKLLFYADLTHFYLRGCGMSGAVYVNRPFGPVADEAEMILNELIETEKVAVAERTKHLEAKACGDSGLSREESRVLDWVLTTYGNMGAREISNLSHTERAYYDTRPNEPIAYAYAQFLKHLPPKSLLQ